jgi:hypothetical protein
MTMSEGLALVGASAPALPDDLAAEFADFSDEQRVMLARAIQLGTVVMGATVNWIRSMRDLHGCLVANCQGNTGWERVCKRVFHLDCKHANGMVRGLECWELRFRAVSGGPTGPLPITSDPSPRFFRELGKVKENLRSTIMDEIAEGKLNLSSIAVVARAKELALEKRLAGIKDIKPALPKAAPRQASPVNLPMAPPPEGITFSLARYREADETTTEMEWYVAHTEKMRKAAVAYRNTCKQLEDRLAKGIADHRHLPAVMTVRQIIWKERDFDLGAAFDAVTAELDEATRLWGLAMPLCNGPAKIVE